MHHLSRRFKIDAAAEVVAAETDAADTQARPTKIADFHFDASQKTRSLLTSLPRSAGCSKSSNGPAGTTPDGLMFRWLM